MPILVGAPVITFKTPPFLAVPVAAWVVGIAIGLAAVVATPVGGASVAVVAGTAVVLAGATVVVETGLAVVLAGAVVVVLLPQDASTMAKAAKRPIANHKTFVFILPFLLNDLHPI